MRLDEVKNLNHWDNFNFAIAVGHESGEMHCTILYKWEDGQIKTIDFWSQQIRSNQSIGDFGQKEYLYVHYNNEVILEDFAIQVPAVCELIKENNNSISFGINFIETKFDASGNLIFAKGEFGLTCATFILAIFQRAGIKLIDLNDWQYRNSDKEWQEKVLNYFKEKHKNDPNSYLQELLDLFQKNIGCFRYKPEEVAVASGANKLPSNFEYCKEFGQRLNDAVSYGIDTYKKLYY